MKKTHKKGFTIVELVIVIAVIAILAAVLIPTFSNVIKKANMSADQQEMTSINTLLAVETVENPNITFADAIRISYDNGRDMITRDKDYCYVWNKKDKKVEYKLKTESLAEDTYEKMAFVNNIDGLVSALEDGGILYLEGTFDAANTVDKVLVVKKDTVIVGKSSTLLVPADIVDNTGTAINAGQHAPLFYMDEDNASLTICGVSMDATDSTNSIVAVFANNCSINLYDCSMTGSNYAINVRNHGFNGQYYYKGNPGAQADDKSTWYNNNLAQDTVVNVNIVNCSIFSKVSAIQCKYVGGTVNVTNSIVSQRYLNEADGCALIVCEGNGLKMNFKECTLKKATGNATSFVCDQCGAHDTVISFEHCEFTGNGTADFKICSPDSDTAALANNKIIVDGEVVAEGN